MESRIVDGISSSSVVIQTRCVCPVIGAMALQKGSSRPPYRLLKTIRWQLTVPEQADILWGLLEMHEFCTQNVN